MAMATTCCLNNLIPPRPPPQNSHSLSPTTTNNHLVPWRKNNGNEEQRWQKRCVLGVAGVVIGLQMVGESGGIEMGNNHVNFVDSIKWSEERMCPQWRLNSLETVVPENLPRPAARRRWDPAALPPPQTHTAPPLRTTRTTSRSTRCFSM